MAIIFSETYPKLCRFLESLLGKNGQAQDIAQESFLRLCQSELEQISAGEARFWLFRVARNLALNELNKKRTQVKFWNRISDLFSFRASNPEEAIERQEMQIAVRELLDELPEHQRSALLLREQEEMNYREIAFVLNISESKVKVDIFRARMSLKDKWRQRQETDQKRFD